MLLKNWCEVVLLDSIDYIRIIDKVDSPDTIRNLYVDNIIETVDTSDDSAMVQFMRKYGDCELVYVSFYSFPGFCESSLVLSFNS